jgi:hypothetical protein
MERKVLREMTEQLEQQVHKAQRDHKVFQEMTETMVQ